MRFKITILLLLILTIVFVAGCDQEKAEPQKAVPLVKTELAQDPASEEYNPVINPDDFVKGINHKFMTYKPRTLFIYEGQVEEGTERVEFYVTEDTKTVMGVETMVIWDRVYLNGDLIETTQDWFAQDKDGNVWYFGEESMEVAGGIILNQAGSWESGVDGALPGIIMKADPKVGESYRQEFYEGFAEDWAKVEALDVSVDVPYGSLKGCLKTLDWAGLEANSEEYKYYCSEPGFVVMEESLEDKEKVVLIDIQTNVDPRPAEVLKDTDALPDEITQEMAEAIALEEVPGTVTDFAIELKFGKLTYVVEIRPDEGRFETDVIIDMETGEILGVTT